MEYAFRCKKSKDCDTGDVCDPKNKVCRAAKRPAQVPKAVYAKECLQKGIPIHYERGPHKGERKNKDAMRHCAQQKDRNVVPYRPSQVKLLNAPSIHSLVVKKPSGQEVGFVRPPIASLQQMRKDELTRIFAEGQRKGYIDPKKSSQALTNKQLMEAIRRANQQKW